MKQLIKNWDYKIVNPQQDFPNSIAVDSHGMVYLLATKGTSFNNNRESNLIKFDTQGIEVWTKPIEISYNRMSLICNQDDHLIIGGNSSNFQSENHPDPHEDIFLMKINSSSGDVIWKIEYGGIDNSTFTSIDLDQNGNIFMIGRHYGDTALQQGHERKIGTEPFIAKFDKDGQLLWTKQNPSNFLPSQSESEFQNNEDYKVFLEESHFVFVRISIDQDDNINLISEESYDGSDYPLLQVEQYDLNGNKKKVIQEGYQFYNNLAVDSKGNILVVRFDMSDMGDRHDHRIIKFDNNGNTVWETQLTDLSPESDIYYYDVMIDSLTVDRRDNIYVTGSVDGSLTKEDKSQGKEDSFIMIFSPKGEILFREQFGTEENDQGVNIKVDKKGNIICVGITRGKNTAANPREKDIFLTSYQPIIDDSEDVNMEILSNVKQLQNQVSAMAKMMTQFKAQLSSLSLQLDADLMVEANKKISKVGDHRISGAEANELVDFAKKGNGNIGKLEQKTLAHIYASYNLTSIAKKTFSEALQE